MSHASNLVADDNNNALDVFVRNLKTGVTQRVSVDSAGAEGNNFSYSSSSALSANGRFVGFASDADNLVKDDNNDLDDVFVRDLKTGVTQRVSVDSAGRDGNGGGGEISRHRGGSSIPALSANGRFVAFASYAGNLVAGRDTWGTVNVFVRDLKTGVTQLVSVDSAGSEANGYSLEPTISANGRFVAFPSTASNLVVGDNNGSSVSGLSPTDIFVHDTKTGVTQRVSVDSEGTEANNDAGYPYSLGPTLSANGRFVAFSSDASNLVTGDNNGVMDIFVRRLLPHCDNQHLR